MGFISDLVSDAIGIVAGVDSDLVESITYLYDASDPVYDTTTGLVTEDQDSVVFNAVRSSLTTNEAVNLDGNPDLEMKSTDRVYLVAAELLGRNPSLTDNITTSGATFRVVGWKSVTGDPLYKIICRRP